MVCGFFTPQAYQLYWCRQEDVLDLTRVMVRPSEARTAEKSKVYTKK
jgi:hypothetical protein